MARGSGDKNKEEDQQTKGDVTLASQQKMGDSSPQNVGCVKDSKASQDECKSVQVQSSEQLGSQETGDDKGFTIAVKGMVVAKTKTSLTQEDTAQPVSSFGQEGEPPDEFEYVHGHIIPMIIKELRNKKKLCDIAKHATQYCSLQRDNNIQKMSPKFMKLSLEIDKVFSMPKIFDRDIQKLLTMAEDLQKNVEIVDPAHEPPSKEEVSVPRVKKPCDPKVPQSSGNKDSKESQVEDGKETTKFKDGKETIKQDDEKETIKNEDEKETTKQEDGKETIKLEDEKEAIKQDDEIETTKLDDEKETIKHEDEKENTKLELEDRKETTKLDDEKQTIKVEDRKETTKLEDWKETFKLEGGKETTKLEDGKETAKNEDKETTKLDDEKKTIRHEDDEEDKRVEEKACEVEGSASKNTTGSDEEDETLLGPSPCDVDKGNISNNDVGGQKEPLPVSSEEQLQSLTQEDDLSSSNGRVVNVSVQTEEETTLLHKETQVSAEAEIVTQHLPAKKDDVVGSEDTTEEAAACAEQTPKKEEEVQQKKVPKSYAEVLKSGDTSGSSSPVKQQKGSHLKEKKKSAGHSSLKVKKFNLKAKQRPQMSPPPTAPTRSSAPQQTVDEEGFQVVKDRRWERRGLGRKDRRSTKARHLSKSTRAEIGGREKKVDSKDVNPFSVLMVNTENLQESENISDLDDNAVSDTEEPGRKEVGESRSATRMTRCQKKREKRKSARRKKKNISREEEGQTRSRRKPSSSTIGTGGTPSLQGSAPRQQKDELRKEESAGCSSPKPGTNLKKKQRLHLSQLPAPSPPPASQEKPNDDKCQVTKGKGKMANANILSRKVDPVARNETQQKRKNFSLRNSNNASESGRKESTTAPTTATALRAKSSPSFPSYFSKKDVKTRIKSAQAVNKTKKTQSTITTGKNEKVFESGVKQTKTSLARAAKFKKEPPSLDLEQINRPQGHCSSNNVMPIDQRKRKSAWSKRDKPVPGNIGRQKEQPTSAKEKHKTPSNVGTRLSIPGRNQGRGTRGSKKTMMVDGKDLKIRSVHTVDPAKKKTLRNTTEKSAPQVKQTKTSLARSRAASFPKDRPSRDSNQNQNQPYSLKDARPTDRKKKESTWSKKDKPGPGNPGRQEKQQTRPKKRPNTSSNVGTGPSIPGSRHGIYSGSRNSKRTMVDGKDIKIRSVQAVDRAKKTPQRNSTTEKSAPQVKQTKTSLARSVHAMDRTKKKTQRNNTTEKSAPQKETKTSLARARKVKPKPTKIAIISPYVRQPRSLNNQRASHRQRNIRYPDYGTINIVHNPLSSTSGIPNLPRSLSQDGLYNNMRGRTDHREECWQSGLSAVESAWHWADGHTADRERKMDHVLAQLLSGLPDQSISTTTDTTGPSGDVAMPNQSLDDVSYIQQEAEHLGDGLIYTLPEEEDAAQASEEEVSQQELSLTEARTMCHAYANSSNHSIRDSNSSNVGQDDCDCHSRFQRPGTTSTRDEVHSQGNVPVTLSLRRGGSDVSHPGGRPPDAASRRCEPAPMGIGQNASVTTSPIPLANQRSRPSEEGRVTPSQREGRSSEQSRAPRIDRTNSFQDQSSSNTNERDQSEERISSCGGTRPVCRVKPFQQQAPVCSCNSIDQGSTRLLHLGGATVTVLDNAGQHLCTKRTPLTPVQNFARSIQAIVFGDLVLMSFTLRCRHGNIIPLHTMLGYEDTTVQVFPADGQVSWSWRIAIDADGFCELEHQERRNEDEDQHYM